MSVLYLSKVWAHSRAEDAALVVLLAIADFADDGGYAYPSVATLAAKARKTERTTQRAIQALQKTGELEVDPQAGRRGCNLYRVIVDRPSPSLPAPAWGDTHVTGDKLTGVTLTTRGGDIDDRGGRHLRHKGVTPMTPEPSGTVIRTVIEPSGKARAKPKQGQLGIDDTPKADPTSDLPENWSPELRQAWIDWCQHRRDKRKPVTPTARRYQIAQLAKWTDRQAIENIEHAIRLEWQGIYDRPKQGRGRGTPVTVVEERFARAF